jgi:two-component system cell cycle sensor histidine kinase/response regulator CckA
MGLAMVYGIAQSHGGGVDLDSEEGRGTRVTICLPAPADLVAPEQLPEAAAPRRGSGRVLVVDDDPAPRAAVRRMLERSGYEVSAFASGQDAVRWFREHGERCDAVLLDLAMPEMDGAACFAALRELRPDVRVVLMSGHGENGDAQRLLDAGVAAFLPKPFGLAELAAAIARVDAAA